MVVIDFYSMGKKYCVNQWLPSAVRFPSFFKIFHRTKYDQHKKITHTGLEQLEGE